MTIDTIKEELKKHGLDDTDVLDFSDSEFRKNFQELLEFYNETIEKHYLYKIHKSVFYIQNETKFLNASATSYKGGFNTICVTGRFVMFLIETFVQPKEEINKLISSFISDDTLFLEEKCDFQYLSVSHFVIYHELAHLIQFVSEKLSYVEEFSSDKDEYKYEKHIYELDADEFAALSLGSHLLQYFDQIEEKGKVLKLKNIEDYMTVSLGAIFTVMVSINADFDQFYIEKRCHPHPITRLILLSLTMINYLNQTYIKDKNIEKLNHIQILNKSIDYANSFNKKFNGNAALEKVPSIVKDNLQNIMAYIGEIRKDAEIMENLAVKAWNDQIMKSESK